jgi:hypothetical protein
VDAQQRDWHLWLPYVKFAYNSSEHSVTGSSPFVLATGRQPRIALHSLLGGLHSSLASPSPESSPVISELVNLTLSRQRAAHDLMSRRHDLRKAKVLHNNERLASRFNLLNRFQIGDKAWWYRAPRTSSVRDPLARDTSIRNVFSKKFQDLWHGPYQVLQVGPSNVNGRILQSNTLLLRIGRGNSYTEQRVNMSQCKPCLDPSNLGTRPTGLPSGFAKYLLARHSAGTPNSISLEDATASTERHGVEAILNHRVRTPHRAATQVLEYRIRWEGDDCAESWEPSHHLDACNDALDEYWRTLDSTGRTLPHSESPLVAARLERVRSVRLSGVQRCICPFGQPYQLPDGVQMITSPLPPHQLKSRAVKGLGVLQVWEVTTAGRKVNTWFEGVITRAPHDRTPAYTNHRARFSDGEVVDIEFAKCPYATVADPAQLRPTAYVLFGTTEQLAQLALVPSRRKR